jgi:hypothetical protein
MADRTITVIQRATNFDFLSVDECKLLLGLDPNDTSQDAQLGLMITINSQMIAEICNRTFAQEKVQDSWREIGHGRIFLSHWPIKTLDDIESVNSGDTPVARRDYPKHLSRYGVSAYWTPTSGYEVELDSGKMSVYGASWTEPTVVTYTGGYILPDEAPKPLKQATAILVREDRLRNMQLQIGGIRSISHEGASVSYYDPSRMLRAVSGKLPGWQAAVDIAMQFTRIEA